MYGVFMMMKQTTIPFSGFYHSIHDEELDRALQLMFSDDQGNPFEGIVDRAFNLINWQATHLQYAKEFAECFASHFEFTTLKFLDLSSPKYYNFETDRIFCEISLDEVISIYEKVDKSKLAETVKKKFTSYDGFISFYPNDISRWPEAIEEWDHNHIGTLIEVWVTQLNDGEYTLHTEYEILSDSLEQAYHIVSNNLQDADRLFKIADYLRQRESRVN
jgi:hypothetical protein